MSVTLNDNRKGIGQTSKGQDYEAGAHVYTVDVFDEEDSGVDPVYHAKAKLLNDVFQKIGMGKYQVSMGHLLTQDTKHTRFGILYILC